MHKCQYTDRIEIKNKLLTRIVRAEYENLKKTVCYSDDVLKHTECNLYSCRHVYHHTFNGYGICFNGEINPFGQIEDDRYYGMTHNCGKSKIPFYCPNEPSDKDLRTVISVYPDFAPVINNVHFRHNEELIETVYFWKKDKECATKLLLNGQKLISNNESFYKYSKKKKNEIIEFCSKYKTEGYKLTDICALITMKSLYPYYMVKELYNFLYALGNKDMLISFYMQTVEFNKLSEDEKEEFRIFIEKDYSNYNRLNYRGVCKIIKSKLKYPKTSFNDLYDLFHNTFYTDVDVLKKFYCDYNDEFKYVVKKYNFTNSEKIRKAFKFWTKYPRETEMLLSYNLDCFALDERYYNESEETKKNVVRFILKYRNIIRNLKIYNYGDIETMEKYCNSDLTDEQMMKNFKALYRISKCDVDSKLINYLNSNKIEFDEYATYYKKVTECGHDINDRYWKMPKNFMEQWDKLDKELANIELLKQEKNNEKYIMTIKAMIEKNKPARIEDYTIFIPQNIKEISYQAEKLKQCLIRCDYPTKVINKSCILIFMEKNEKPYATCEISKDKSILQFRTYNNEIPSEHDNVLMKEYLKTFKVDYLAA